MIAADHLAALRQFATDPRLREVLTLSVLPSSVAFAALRAGLRSGLGLLAERVE